jgi:hypothetical protein
MAILQTAVFLRIIQIEAGTRVKPLTFRNLARWMALLNEQIKRH